MKAISIDKPRSVGIIDVAEPKVRKNEAIVKIKIAGICGSDLGSYLGTFSLVTYPRVPGHELAGEIVEISKNDRGLAVGDRVTIEPLVRCGHCYPCRIGRYNCCENLTVMGVHIDGGMQEYFRAPVHLVHKLPDDMHFDKAALIEPLTIGIHSVNRSKLSKGETALILGAGPIGLVILVVAKSRGAKVISVDLLESRLEQAREFGADYTINPSAENVKSAVEQITKGEMANVVFEAIGARETIENTIYLVSYAGRIVMTGYAHEPALFREPQLITKKELDVLGSRNSQNDFPNAIRFIQSSKFHLTRLITHLFPYTEVRRAFSILETKSEPVTKILLSFS
ncbi:zinc-binding alcohol dehydrogenase family protein [bacterium]|nr:zinc-binding alcohol dehydrogenase family protein [bacterium]